MKRGYSKEFRPHGATGKRYLLDEIPAGLWRDVREKAKRDGISLRALILKLLKEWVLANPCGVVGEPEAGRKVCELPLGHEGYHRQGNVSWLGYHPRSGE